MVDGSEAEVTELMIATLSTFQLIRAARGEKRDADLIHDGKLERELVDVRRV